MLFRLFNLPASFQGYINKILAEKLNIFIIVYLDDILIYTQEKGQDYVDAVEWVPNFLKKYGLFPNLKKCWFYKNKVWFLGYIVLAQRVQMKDKRIEVVKN